MRQLKAALSFVLMLAIALPALAAGEPIKVTLYKNPNCGCCDVWADHMRSNGFDVVPVNTMDMVSIKKKYGVPEALEACHTAVAGRYVFEGLIPADLVKKVLSESRPIKGIALPGMPSGAPGMPGRKAGPLGVYYISDTPSKFASF